MSETENDKSTTTSKKELKKQSFFQRLKKKKKSKPEKDKNAVDAGEAGKRRGPRKAANGGIKNTARKHRDLNSQIYIGGLPYKMTEDDVRGMFASCGPIKTIHLPINKAGKPAGYGFVTFAAEESISQALALDGHEIDGRFIQVRHGAYEQSDKSSREIIAAALQKKKEQQQASSKKGKKARKIEAVVPKAGDEPAESAPEPSKRPPTSDSAEELFGNVDFNFGETPGSQNPSRKSAKRDKPAHVDSAPHPKKPKVVKF